jgi:amino acid transporter
MRPQLLELVDPRTRGHAAKSSSPVLSPGQPYIPHIAVSEPPAHVKSDKGLQADALGLVGNIVMGLASVAPAYSLAATLGFVVAEVGEKSPSMFVLAFIPMLLVAFAYRELSHDTPDCGTTFTWATTAFGPWVGWIGGWGLAVSAIIVLANVAEIAAIYLFRFLGLDSLAENLTTKVLLGSFFIIAMSLISARGIVLSARIQNILIAIQFGVLIIVSIIALFRVFSETAGDQAITPQLSWLWPSGLDASSIALAMILCIFIYWGWDTCLAVGEETRGSDKTPGRAAVITTLILVCTYVLVAYAVQSFLRGLWRGRHRPEQSGERRRRIDHPRRAGVRQHRRGAAAAADSFGIGVVVHADDNLADCQGNIVDGCVRSHP